MLHELDSLHSTAEPALSPLRLEADSLTEDGRAYVARVYARLKELGEDSPKPISLAALYGLLGREFNLGPGRAALYVRTAEGMGLLRVREFTAWSPVNWQVIDTLKRPSRGTVRHETGKGQESPHVRPERPRGKTRKGGNKDDPPGEDADGPSTDRTH